VGSIRTCLLLFRTEAAVRTHVAYMPGQYESRGLVGFGVSNGAPC
jgi:hypothetical protein